jgi:hypothetical protein
VSVELACRRNLFAGQACFNGLHLWGTVNRNLYPLALAALGVILAIGCGPSQKLPANSASSVSRPQSVTLARTVVTPTEALNVDELYQRGMRRLAAGQHAQAAVDLETAAGAAPEQSWAPMALYQAALARDELGEFSSCAENFKRVVHDPRSAPEQRDAQVRLLRVLVFLERWSEAGHEADSFLARYNDPRPLEVIVAKGARALAELSAGDLSRAERDVESARSIIEDQQFQIPARIPRDVAVVYFALGELRRYRAGNIRFVPAASNFSEQLEQRCQLLLDAQFAYSMSMRAYDAHWSIMAGYRVGELYAKLHADLMELLAADLTNDPQRKRLFEAALRLRYSILLSKAVSSMEHTLTAATRTHESSNWVQLTRDAYQGLKTSLAQEQAALDAIPYSRQEMQSALENLRQNRGSHAARAEAPGRAK